MIKTVMSVSRFEFLMEEIKYKLLSPEQGKESYFDGDEAKFEEWAGDALSDAIEYVLNEVGIEVDWDN
jgi:hypothetical protein